MRERLGQFRLLLAAPLFAATLVLSGCGGVQFEGKAFEAIGLGDKPKKQEQKVADRAPLILPPKRELPAPGPSQRIASPEQWPVDPNEAQRQQAKQKKRKPKRCGDNKFDKKSSIREFDELNDPLLACKGLADKGGVVDAARAEGSPDKVVEQSDDLSTKKEPPAPWRSQTKQN